MDKLSRAYYEVAFERDFLKKKGAAFQDFFSEIMEKRYPGDFQRVRPWGNIGDRKNDGYVKSKRMLFQSYAPNEMTAAEAVKKIEEDFNGAVPHWKDHFNKWVFVHNSRDGVGPEVAAKLLELGKANPSFTLEQWGFEEMRQEAFQLGESELASLLGPAPTDGTMLTVKFKDIEVVLKAIAGQAPADGVDMRPVPKDKIQKNALSADVVTLLQAGMKRSHLVGKFFEGWHDATFGDFVAASFKAKYLELKRTGLAPDAIFCELQAFAGGRSRTSAENEAAVLAILAFLFEECEIFERPTPAAS